MDLFDVSSNTKLIWPDFYKVSLENSINCWIGIASITFLYAVDIPLKVLKVRALNWSDNDVFDSKPPFPQTYNKKRIKSGRLLFIVTEIHQIKTPPFRFNLSTPGEKYRRLNRSNLEPTAFLVLIKRRHQTCFVFVVIFSSVKCSTPQRRAGLVSF